MTASKTASVTDPAQAVDEALAEADKTLADAALEDGS